MRTVKIMACQCVCVAVGGGGGGVKFRLHEGDYYIVEFNSGLPFVSILRGPPGLPAATFRGFLSSFKAVLKYSALHVMPFVLFTTQFWVYFSQTMTLLVVHYQVCWLIITVIGLFKGLISYFSMSVLLWWLAALPIL